MTVLQVLVNVVLAILGYVLAGMLLSAVGVGGTLNALVSIVVAVLVFVANPASRLGVK